MAKVLEINARHNCVGDCSLWLKIKLGPIHMQHHYNTVGLPRLLLLIHVTLSIAELSDDDIVDYIGDTT